MQRSLEFLENETNRQWVRYHVVGLILIVGTTIGMLIIDQRIGEYVPSSDMPQLRTFLFLSVLSAGVGARALLARNTATVDTQGWIFLVAVGMLLLAVAAYGFADCYDVVREKFDVVRGTLEERARASTSGSQ